MSIKTLIIFWPYKCCSSYDDEICNYNGPHPTFFHLYALVEYLYAILTRFFAMKTPTKPPRGFTKLRIEM